MTYYINEKQNANSHRDGAKKTSAMTLTAAKRAASRAQFFRGTVVTVEDAAGTTLAYKEPGENWVDLGRN